eukprot:1236685-Pleurochrysis_carterae.AAC.1
MNNPRRHRHAVPLCTFDIRHWQTCRASERTYDWRVATLPEVARPSVAKLARCLPVFGWCSTDSCTHSTILFHLLSTLTFSSHNTAACYSPVDVVRLQVLHALRDANVVENTLTVFTSDHQARRTPTCEMERSHRTLGFVN